MALDLLHNPADNYQGIWRSRGLGGTSHKWAGKLLPLSPGDMAARPHLDLEAWPIDRAALMRYLPEIEAMMAVAPGSYEQDQDAALDPGHRLPAQPDGVVWRWPKRPSNANHRIDHVPRDRLARLGNLSVWSGATVTDAHAETGRLVSVSATNQQGGLLTVAADQFVIAAGTLETTRLLLADAQNHGCISRITDSLGRYFNDHFGIQVAAVGARPLTRANRALADRQVRRTMRHLHGELAPKLQAAQAVASAYFDFDAAPAPRSAISEARAVVADLRARDIAAATRHLAATLADPLSLTRALWSRGLRGQQFWPDDARITAKIWLEQLSRAGNRLRLADRRDGLGVPMLQVELTHAAIDDHTLRTAMRTLATVWSRDFAAFGPLEWLADASSKALVETTIEQAHPAGSTRMGSDAARSVVDPALRVHALPNVHVASASVFPSSGSANPTLTIMQLAMLASDAVIAAE